MTVGELRKALADIDQDRQVAVTLSYQTGDHAPLHDIGAEGDDRGEMVCLFPTTCLDGSCP